MQQQNKRPNKIDLYKEKMNERREIEKNFMYNPFGRGGNGAPMRDFNGNVITTRKNLSMNNNFNNLYDDPQNFPIYREDTNLQGNNQSDHEFFNQIYPNLNKNELQTLAFTSPPQFNFPEEKLSSNNFQRNTPNNSSLIPQNKVSNTNMPKQFQSEIPNEKSKFNSFNSYQIDLLKQIEEKKLQKEMEKRKAADLDRLDEEKYKQYLQLKKDQEEQIKNKKSRFKIYLF
jgi:centrosome and spindle pole-associated protein 1